MVDVSPRQRPIKSGAPGPPGSDGSGGSGNPTRATAEYGQKIVELQIDAAVRQIQRLRETRRVSRQGAITPADRRVRGYLSPRVRNPARRLLSTRRSRFCSVKTLPRVESSSFFMSSRRTLKPRPPMQGTTSKRDGWSGASSLRDRL